MPKLTPSQIDILIALSTVDDGPLLFCRKKSTLSWLMKKKLVTMSGLELSKRWHITGAGRVALIAGRI